MCHKDNYFTLADLTGRVTLYGGKVHSIKKLSTRRVHSMEMTLTEYSQGMIAGKIQPDGFDKVASSSLGCKNIRGFTS